MKNQLTITRFLFGKAITADVTIMDAGVNVLLTGGEKAHIGAVTIISPEGRETTTAFEGHREVVLSGHWAREIAKKGLPVSVEAGIHYDHASSEQIQEILRVCEEMLFDVLHVL